MLPGESIINTAERLLREQCALVSNQHYTPLRVCPADTAVCFDAPVTDAHGTQGAPQQQMHWVLCGCVDVNLAVFPEKVNGARVSPPVHPCVLPRPLGR